MKNILLNLFIILIIGFICSLNLIKYFSNNISKSFIIKAEEEVTRLINLILNESIDENIIREIDERELIKINKNDNGDIQIVSYDTVKINLLLNSIAIIIQNNLEAIENGNIKFIELDESKFKHYDSNLLKHGIVTNISFGSFSNNALISSIGPKIPIKYQTLGHVNTDIKTNIKEYGINNVLLELIISIEVNVRVSLPFISKKIKISNDIPVSIKLIQGILPKYYKTG